MVDIPVSAATPTGTLTASEDLYIEGAPYFYFGGEHAQNPDPEGFYWGLTGTAENPVFAVGCYEDFRFGDDVTINAVRCDTIGDAALVQRRNFMYISFTLKSMLPFDILSRILRGGDVEEQLADPGPPVTEGTEIFGFGEIDNTVFYLCYFSRVYDPDAGDFVAVTGHRCQFVDAWEIATPWAEAWRVGVTMRLFADDDMPVDQRFATMIRLDPSELV